MNKKLLTLTFLILVVLTTGFLFKDKLRDYITNGGTKSLATFHFPTDLLAKLGQDTSLLPSPLKDSVENKNSYLTRSGVILQTNLQRKNNSLPALKENALLNKDAESKLKDLFEKQYFEHVSPSGVAPADLADKVGYKYILVGENLALGNFENDKELVDAWMNSPGHRANILNNRYLEIGVAVGKGMYEGHETWIAVQSFGTPLSSCPSVNTAEKQQIDANRSQINQLAAQLTQRKAQIDSATYQSQADYNQAVADYNALVEKFNALVEQTKALVNDYNSQVNKVNQCINS